MDCVDGGEAMGLDRRLVVAVSLEFELDIEREPELVVEAEEAGVIVGRDSVTEALRSKDSVGAGRVSETLAAC